MNADRRFSRRAVLGLIALAPFPSMAQQGGAAQGFAGQGFAGLGAASEGYADPVPGRALAFPADLGPHPEFRTEWWYVTANLIGDDGRDYGVQWTLFRQAMAAPDPTGGEAQGWADRHAWMGHAALTTADSHVFAQRLARGGIGQAGAQADPFQAWIDDWSFAATGDDWALRAAGPDFAYALRLTPRGPFVAQGQDGYSVKSAAGQASHYFSQPFFDAQGALTPAPGAASVAVRGRAWLDREWSSQPLAPDQRGWDWISLHLDGGAKLMAFALRSDSAAPFHSGTWIGPDGTPAPLSPDAIRLEGAGARRVAGRRIPLRWRVRVPAHGVDLRVTPLNDRAWNAGAVSYWEGPVRAAGSHSGAGYMELTGY